MKRSLTIIIATCILFTSNTFAEPLGTGFTYQGELKKQGAPANGTFDFEFNLFDVMVDGLALTASFRLEDVNVQDGVFTVELDFGSDVLDGTQLWLGIAVRDGASTGGYTGLLPRQKITPVPYALHAKFVSVNAVGAAEVDSTEVQLRVGDSCTAGSSIRAIDIGGNVTCETDTDTINTDADLISSGTLHTDRFDAFDDLLTAGRLDNDASTDILQRSQLDSRFINAGGAYSDLSADDRLNNNADSDLLTRVQSDNRYLAAGTSYYSVGDGDFLSGNNDAFLTSGGTGGSYLIVTGWGWLAAGVHLPHGAVVTNFKVVVNDDVAGDLTVTLAKQYDSGSVAMAEVTSSGTPGIQTYTDSTISSATIDNDLHSYKVRVYSADWPGTFTLSIKRAVVEYTMN